MRQILQSLRTGEIEVVDTPCPSVGRGHLLIRSHVSLISAGTERMLLEFGRAGWLSKARQQPDKVRQVIDKVRTDGVGPTLQSVRAKLDQPLPLGYCNVGTVIDVGAGVTEFQVGDRVVSNGNHAEVVCVPKNLCAKVPDGVSDEAAAFTVLGAIGLQGIRLAEPTLGETFVVSGLGLIGLVAVQFLRAHGCRVLGLDFSRERLQMARDFGAETVDLSRGEDPVAAAIAFSRGRGVDGVIITASTRSNEPMHQAALMCRKRGRIVLVGVVGLELSRADFYEKELSFRVSCSYGPGRYDAQYEEKGNDYPIGFVRWTEQRNFEAVLDMLADSRVHVEQLISHRFALERAAEAYDLVAGGGGGSLGLLLEYPKAAEAPETQLRRRTVRLHTEVPAARPTGTAPTLGFIGAGAFAAHTLIPAFQQAGAQLDAVASRSGLTSLFAGRKFGFAEATTEIERVLANRAIDAVVVATRHDSHADLVCRALEAGKHVFVEKPLALCEEDVARIEEAYARASRRFRPVLMVGFNRRFAPHVQKMAALLEGISEPKSFIMTVNAGMIPPEFWVHDPKAGGGRIVGEGCHFIDLLRFLCGRPITAVQAAMFGPDCGERIREDKMTFTLQFADGSFGTVHYLANGHRGFPKERLEVFSGGRILQMDNFRRLTGYGWKGFRKLNLWQQDKGHSAGAKAFIEAVQSGAPAPISFEELTEVTRASFAVMQAAHTGETVRTASDPVNRTRPIENVPEGAKPLARSA